jgi:uncharacterized protein
MCSDGTFMGRRFNRPASRTDFRALATSELQGMLDEFMTMQTRCKKLVVLLLGWGFVALGVVGLFLPVLQGVLFLLIGLFILSSEYVWAHRLLRKVRNRFPTAALRCEEASRKAQDWLGKVFRRAGQRGEFLDAIETILVGGYPESESPIGGCENVPHPIRGDIVTVHAGLSRERRHIERPNVDLCTGGGCCSRTQTRRYRRGEGSRQKVEN